MADEARGAHAAEVAADPAEHRHGDGASDGKDPAKTARDPVCGMMVDPHSAAPDESRRSTLASGSSASGSTAADRFWDIVAPQRGSEERPLLSDLVKLVA